jgi:hypothetical protein
MTCSLSDYKTRARYLTRESNAAATNLINECSEYLTKREELRLAEIGSNRRFLFRSRNVRATAHGQRSNVYCLFGHDVLRNSNG